MSSEQTLPGMGIGSCIAGIPIRLHFTFLVLLLFQVLAVWARYREPLFTLFVFVLYGPVLLLTVLIHEFGHALTTKRLGGEVDCILLWPLGGFAVCGPTSGGVAQDLWVALAGPLTHIPQALFWLGLYACVHPDGMSGFTRVIDLNALSDGDAAVFFSALAAQAILLNAGIFVFNLIIPAYPLDGGRCLAALLVLGGFQVYTAAITTSVLALVLALTMVGLGLFLYIAEQSTSGIFIALIAAFIIHSSWELFRMTRSGHVHEHPLFDRECYKGQEQISDSLTQEELPMSEQAVV